MTLVDTSAWIEFLGDGDSGAQVAGAQGLRAHEAAVLDAVGAVGG